MPEETEKCNRRRLLPALLLLLALLLAGCAQPEPEPTPTPEPTLSPRELAEDTEKIVISELMLKNRATITDEDGDFSDWIELENISGESVDLGGWTLTDKAGTGGWTLPERSLGPGERLLLFASGKDRAQTLHTDFSLSPGEMLTVRNRHGCTAAAVLCPETEADQSLCREADGSYSPSLYPTPGEENSPAGYDQWQESLAAPGPLVISEVMAANFSTYYDAREGYCDWVEIQNISQESVNLADYYLSDDGKDYRRWRLPERSLAPGELLVVCCDGDVAPGELRADFSLDSVREELFLSGPDYSLVDYVSLRDIPYECSYGRRTGENGWFFFDRPSPGWDNAGGYRRVSAPPESLEPDGSYDGVDAVTVELSAAGTIYYTLDASLPTQGDSLYEGPIRLESTAVLRAVSVEEGAMPSRPLTLSYFINEGHSLPVLSLVSNNASEFNSIYSNGTRHHETPGNLAFYEPGGSFNIPCGIRMYGETSLKLPKKNMSVRFRGAYGQDSLHYDLYGGGVTDFSNFVLRAGQDYYNTVIRNELGLNLALQLTDNIMSLRSRYCVLYTDGQYRGVYALEEKSNEAHYANLIGVDRDSVTVLESQVSANSLIWTDVFDFCIYHDMSKEENYEYFCSKMDVDSLIDWIIMEGYTANADLTYGNLRYCHSTQGDGKWRLMLYDLDSTFSDWDGSFYNIFSPFWLDLRQVSRIIRPLMRNEEFVDRLLTRAGEAFNTVLTNENVVAEIDRLADQVRPDLPRDFARYGRYMSSWENNIETLKNFIQGRDWRQHCINSLSYIFDLTQEEKEHYFGQ